MAITSASLLQYPVGVILNGDTPNTTLTNRKYVNDYVAGDIFGYAAWDNTATTKTYYEGDVIHYNGLLYRCISEHAVAKDAPFDSSKWERLYPVLHKYTGEAVNGVVEHGLGTTDVTVQVYERGGSSPNYTWTPVMVNFAFDSSDPTNKINLVGLTSATGNVYRVVIVAAK